MLKKLFLILLAIFICAGYFIGSYFVDFALSRGNSDDPNAIPAACASIHDESRTVPPLPNFSSEILSIQSNDNLTLNATHFFPEKSTNRWAILVHGYGRDQRFARDYAQEYLLNNFNVLTPDLRASGTSEGKFLTMGVKESEDISLWIDKIIQENPNAQIILHGVSMGAATVILTSEKNLPQNVKAIVEDCSYTSAYDMFCVQLDKIFGLPAFPIMNFVDIVSKIKTGSAISDANPLAAVENTKIPMLFIHGDADKLVPVNMMNQLFEKSKAPFKEKIIFQGAGHADSMSIDKKNYFGKIFEFCERFL